MWEWWFQHLTRGFLEDVSNEGTAVDAKRPLSRPTGGRQLPWSPCKTSLGVINGTAAVPDDPGVSRGHTGQKLRSVEPAEPHNSNKSVGGQWCRTLRVKVIFSRAPFAPCLLFEPLLFTRPRKTWCWSCFFSSSVGIRRIKLGEGLNNTQKGGRLKKKPNLRFTAILEDLVHWVHETSLVSQYYQLCNL